MNRNLNRRIHPIAEANGLSPKNLVRIMTNDIYICRSLSFSYEKVKKNSALLNKIAQIAVRNELTIKPYFVGKSGKFAHSDREWYERNKLANEGFIPDRTINIDTIQMPKNDEGKIKKLLKLSDLG